MIKKLFIAAAFILAGSTAFSQQENEYVEVVVKDTVNLDADELIFKLILQADIESSPVIDTAVYTGDKTVTNQYKPAVKPETEQKVKKIIEKLKIDTLPDSQFTLSKDIYTGLQGKQMLLRFTSARQLAVFIKEIKNLDNISGFIQSKKISHPEQSRQQLTKKILEKAFTEASYIALQSKKLIVKLMLVTEENETAAAGSWTSYPPLSALAEITGNYADNNYQVTLERRFRVRYSWK